MLSWASSLADWERGAEVEGPLLDNGTLFSECTSLGAPVEG